MEVRVRRCRQQVLRVRVLAGFAIVGLLVPNALLITRVVAGAPLFDPYVLTYFVLATGTFLVWVGWDASRSGVTRWWICASAAVLLGVCFALPMYLLMREQSVDGYLSLRAYTRIPGRS